MPLGDNRPYFPTAGQINSKYDIFAPQGLDKRGNDELAQILNRFGIANFGPAASRQAFNAGLEGDYQGQIMAVLDRLKNRNYAVQAQRASAQVQSLGAEAQKQADLRARASGFGQGAQLGSLAGLNSKITRQAAAAQESVLDPRRKDADMAQALGILGQAQQSNPYLDNVLKAHPGYAQWSAQNQAAHQGQGFFNQIAGMAGQFLGQNGFPSLRMSGGGSGKDDGYDGGWLMRGNHG